MSIAAHSGREIVLFSNYSVADLELQRLDDLQDSSVVLLTDDRLEDSLEANCWCHGAFRQCGDTADSRALHYPQNFTVLRMAKSILPRRFHQPHQQ